MQVKVWLPPLLRGDGDPEEIVGEGETLQDLLSGIGGRAAHALSSASAAESGLNVYVNGAQARDGQVRLKDGDEIVLVPPIRGGR